MSTEADEATPTPIDWEPFLKLIDTYLDTHPQASTPMHRFMQLANLTDAISDRTNSLLVDMRDEAARQERARKAGGA